MNKDFTIIINNNYLFTIYLMIHHDCYQWHKKCAFEINPTIKI